MNPDLITTAQKVFVSFDPQKKYKLLSSQWNPRTSDLRIKYVDGKKALKINRFGAGEHCSLA